MNQNPLIPKNLFVKKRYCLSPHLLFVAALLSGNYCIAAQDNALLPQAAMDRDMLTVHRLLENRNINSNSLGPFDTPALHWAVRIDDIETSRLLINSGADVNLATPFGVTPLSLAVANGNFDMVKLLLTAGADANTRELSGESILMSAANIGELAVLTELVKYGARVNTIDPHFGQTALMFAARSGKTLAVKFLLAQGADPNASTIIGETPKWIGPNSVPGFGFGIGIIRGGVPADRGRREPIEGGMTPLLYAARHNHVEVAQALLDAGAEIDKVEANNISPLLMAISNNQVEAAHFFIESGSDINLSDWYGRSPLWEAVNVRNLYVHNGTFVNEIKRSPFIGLIQSLLKKGADVNARTAETPPFRHHLLPITGSLEWVDFTGQTPFLTAALAGDVSVMRILLEHNADPLIQTYEGTSALMAAAGINWVVAQTYTESPASLLQAVQLCWELGMDVNQTNSMGLSALHGAANRGSDDIIQFLVDKGAKLTIADNEQRSPLDWAQGVFLATHPAEPKPTSIALISALLNSNEN